LTAAAVSWAVLIWTTPALAAHQDRTAPVVLAAAVYGIGTFVCHQAPARSFHVAGIRTPVCARCAGLYVGAALGLLLGFGRGRRDASRLSSRTALLAFAAPTALTWAVAALGLWDPGNVLRAVAALPLGAVASALVAAVVSGELR
jgi:uncharacterized membrane protein